LRSAQQFADVDAAANQIVAVLREARDRTVSTDSGTAFGVHFEAGQYVRFAGPTYSAGAVTNVLYTLPQELELYDINVGEDSDILFNSLDGTPDQAGSTSIRAIDDPGQYRTIEILSTGAIGIAGSVNPTDSRITDTRHVHFDLGWSMQNSNTLTLRFSDPPNPDVVQNVSISAYMNADNTNFDWSDAILVGGEEQALRIHTHLLNSGDTELSIHRDRRFNTKAVTISIDGDEIASYDADGTVTAGFFGGTMEIQ